ncbi:HK97 family phage prohead protease [Bradyrhizobium erythrophlei]|uniref:HK97 family phage prohead protease n=1 Tax=Bradyrhizobium erythrophlei TaxID=1437360 RepID=UPI0035EA33CE
MSEIDLLRQEALARRIKGVDGGNRVHWDSKQAAELRDWIMSMREDAFRAAAAPRKFIDSAASLASIRAKLMKSSALAADAGQPGNPPWIFRITTPDRDLAGDSILPDGVQSDPKNLPVLLSHDSIALPVARSSAPWRVDQSILAVANFPAPGISPRADEVAAMVRAGQLRGASIGFVPVRYKLSTDPANPTGITFTEIRLIEWSLTGTPCNQSCWAIGPAAAKSASRNVPLNDFPLPEEAASDWECHAISTMPIDASDDAYDPAKSKAALLEKFSPDGTILDGARDYFFAVKPSAPLDANSYQFPFCRVGGGAVIASKVGWRQSFAALEKSSMPGTVISQARALVDVLEERLGEIKMAARLREARELAAKARASISHDDRPPTREQRLAEAAKFRRQAYGI